MRSGPQTGDRPHFRVPRRSALGDERPLSAPLRAWLARTLQLDVRRAFASAPEAAAALEELASDDTMYVAAPVALETFLSRYIASLLEPPVQAAVPVTASVPAAVAAHQPAPHEPLAALADLAPAPVVPAPVAAVIAPASMADAILASVDDDDLMQEEEEDEDEEEEDTAIERHEASHAHAPHTLFNPAAPFTAQPVQSQSAPRGPRRRMGLAVAAAVVVALATAGFAGFKAYGRSAAAPALGALNVQSSPADVPVFVDGVARGRTPVRLTLAAGAHILELRGSSEWKRPDLVPLSQPIACGKAP